MKPCKPPPQRSESQRARVSESKPATRRHFESRRTQLRSHPAGLPRLPGLQQAEAAATVPSRTHRLARLEAVAAGLAVLLFKLRNLCSCFTIGRIIGSGGGGGVSRGLCTNNMVRHWSVVTEWCQWKTFFFTIVRNVIASFSRRAGHIFAWRG